MIRVERFICIPPYLDCRELKYRVKDAKPGSIVLCKQVEIAQLVTSTFCRYTLEQGNG